MGECPGCHRLAVVGCCWLWLGLVQCVDIHNREVSHGLDLCRRWSQWQMKVMDWSTLMVTYWLLGDVSWDDHGGEDT